eukprot:scaffold8253_cov267-Pinguiococcus_pyrenoidosus.AAC.3
MLSSGMATSIPSCNAQSPNLATGITAGSGGQSAAPDGGRGRPCGSENGASSTPGNVPGASSAGFDVGLDTRSRPKRTVPVASIGGSSRPRCSTSAAIRPPPCARAPAETFAPILAALRASPRPVCVSS